MRKRVLLMFTISCILLLISGCGGSIAAERTTVEVKKNGGIVHTIVTDFTESYYDLDGLKAMIEDSCKTYNGSMGSGAVSLKRTALEDGVLRVVMNYKNASAYAGYNKQALYTGTVQSAYEMGYDFNVTLHAADQKEATIGKEELLQMGDSHIVIIREAVDVKVWDEVRYYSDDVVLNDDGSLSVTDSAGLSFIVFG